LLTDSTFAMLLFLAAFAIVFACINGFVATLGAHI
jgi:hypothetical protein